MKRLLRLMLVLLLVAAFLPAGAAKAQAVTYSCESFALPGTMAVSGTAPSGSETCIIMPQVGWNGGLVIFAHGYVFAYPPNKPVTIPWEQMIIRDPQTGMMTGTIPQLILAQGFAFATTSYSKNGLAVVEGVNDVLELVDVFKAQLAANLPAGAPVPDVPVFLVGASEGGLVTTLAVEGYPKVFRGGVAACGPIGDFREQINYWGDLRVVYDHYFPGNMLGSSAMVIPPETMAGWGNLYDMTQWGPVLALNYSLINADLTYNGGLSTQRLLAATGAPVDQANPLTVYQTILGILEYNVMATNEAIVELGGKPYQNLDTVYSTYPPDPTLNDGVERLSADKEALKVIKKDYQTKGLLKRPLVVMHTTGDPIVPYWHATMYQDKVIQHDSAQNLGFIEVQAYGHCNFTAENQMAAFSMMLSMASQQP